MARDRGNDRARRTRTGRKGRRSKEMVEIAKERIDILFDKAMAEEGGAQKRAKRYVDLALRIGMRYNVRIRPAHRRAFCRDCGAMLPSSSSSRVRVRRGRVVVSCKKCGHVWRYGIRPKKRRGGTGAEDKKQQA